MLIRRVCQENKQQQQAALAVDGLPAPMPCKPFAAPPPFILLFFLLHTLSIIMKSWAPNQLRSLLARCPASRRDTHVPLSLSIPPSPPLAVSMNCILVIQLAIEAIAHTPSTHNGNRLSRLFINKREAANEESTKYAGKLSAVC